MCNAMYQRRATALTVSSLAAIAFASAVGAADSRNMDDEQQVGQEVFNELKAKGEIVATSPLAADLIGEGIVGRSRALQNVLEQLDMVAPTDATVLICGETGTGKELIARAVHNMSGRRAHPFVSATARRSPPVSSRASSLDTRKVPSRAPLRVVQEREFEPLGSSRTLHSEARLVTATNVNLPDMVDAKRFRADLYYRLNVFPIHVPPLRERPEDIPPLVRHFARHYARRMSRKAAWMPSTAMDALVRYSWPGNIRELQNLIERAVTGRPANGWMCPCRKSTNAWERRRHARYTAPWRKRNARTFSPR